MRCGVMQPYIFPYIGYFQLITAADKFVFCDDVNYIKGGWVNRNMILVNGHANRFTIPLVKSSPNKLINEIEIYKSKHDIKKLLTTIQQSYKKAPYFSKVFPIIINDVLTSRENGLADMAISSILSVCRYLQIEKEFYTSSKDFADTRGTEKTDRLISITKKLNCDEYIDTVGGVKIYNKAQFMDSGVNLNFVQSDQIIYSQFSDNFVPNLSITDVIMFNNIEQTHDLLRKFTLI